MSRDRNVLGEPLVLCCSNPKTGFARDGFCRTGPLDFGNHTVCAVVTRAFLDFTRMRGNDLESPQPDFPGLKPGDSWCLCAGRWLQAFHGGVAPPVRLEACHERCLEVIDLDILKQFAIDGETSTA